MSCARCGETAGEFSAVPGYVGLYCYECEMDLVKLAFADERPKIVEETPVVVDLAAEGQALSNILGSLSGLNDTSKFRVLAAVKLLVGPAELKIYSPGSAYLPTRTANGDGDPLVAASLARLAELQGLGDPDA